MMLQALCQGDVPQAMPTASLDITPSLQDEPAAAMHDGAARQFRIELPPTQERDTDALMAELGLLGHIEKSMLEGGRAVFTLRGNTST
ncbi:chemotaxis protein CheA, partial [Bacillus pumilus]|uniref:hypothetical protein n=1 Tax=Bacillus pumilus TaxID=1408 RepID=UPI0019BBC05D